MAILYGTLSTSQQIGKINLFELLSRTSFSSSIDTVILSFLNDHHLFNPNYSNSNLFFVSFPHQYM